MEQSLFAGRAFAAFLFDMDGTLVDSIAAANRVWRRWADNHGIDPEIVIRTMHGMRAVDTIRHLNLPDVDAEREADAVTQAEIADVEGVVAITGAGAFLRSLPADRWAIVTSAPRALAVRRIEAAGLPMPSVLVTADDVTKGKPAPDCFLVAAQSLGVAAQDCLVWEDTRAGIDAAEAAGAAIIVVSVTHKTPIGTNHPVIVDYEGLAVALDGSLALSVSVWR